MVTIKENRLSRIHPRHLGNRASRDWGTHHGVRKELYSHRRYARQDEESNWPVARPTKYVFSRRGLL